MFFVPGECVTLRRPLANKWSYTIRELPKQVHFVPAAVYLHYMLLYRRGTYPVPGFPRHLLILVAQNGAPDSYQVLAEYSGHIRPTLKRAIADFMSLPDAEPRP